MTIKMTMRKYRKNETKAIEKTRKKQKEKKTNTKYKKYGKNMSLKPDIRLAR